MLHSQCIEHCCSACQGHHGIRGIEIYGFTALNGPLQLNQSTLPLLQAQPCHVKLTAHCSFNKETTQGEQKLHQWNVPSVLKLHSSVLKTLLKDN